MACERDVHERAWHVRNMSIRCSDLSSCSSGYTAQAAQTAIAYAAQAIAYMYMQQYDRAYFGKSKYNRVGSKYDRAVSRIRPCSFKTQPCVLRTRLCVFWNTTSSMLQERRVSRRDVTRCRENVPLRSRDVNTMSHLDQHVDMLTQSR